MPYPIMLLAIDPGCDTGWSIYGEDTRLISCGLGDVRAHPGPLALGRVERVVIESPRLRPFGEKNPNAILKLARNAGEWGGRFDFAKVEYILPNDWKGSTPETISTARTKLRLDIFELATVDAAFARAKGRNGLAPSKRHNVWDAIGIGLWAVGRRDPR